MISCLILYHGHAAFHTQMAQLFEAGAKTMGRQLILVQDRTPDQPGRLK